MKAGVESVRGPWELRAIFLFVMLVVLFDVPFDGVAIHAGRGEMVSGLVITAARRGSGLAALTTCVVFGRRFRDLGFGWPQTRYTWCGYMLPLLYATATMARSGGWVLPRRGSPSSRRQPQLMWGSAAAPGSIPADVATYGVLKACANALGEEIGWRGFLVPALADRLRFPDVVLVSGLNWGAWHVPCIL